MGNRRQARELTLQILYEIELSGAPHKEVIDRVIADRHPGEDGAAFVLTLVEGTLRNLKEIDGLITETSSHWKMTRMPAVDRNLLRLSTFELVYLNDIPLSVSINEAVEIAKKFGTGDSAAFVNGVLDKIAEGRKK